MTFFDWYWLSWLVGIFTFFLPVELWAIFSKHAKYTFSDTMWAWTNHVGENPVNIGAWPWPHYLLAAFMIWLTLHLVFGLLG